MVFGDHVTKPKQSHVPKATNATKTSFSPVVKFSLDVDVTTCAVGNWSRPIKTLNNLIFFRQRISEKKL